MPLLGVDLKKAKKELALGCPPLQERKVEIITYPAQLQELRNAINGRIAVDIENDRDLNLSCLGIAVHKDVAFVIPAEEPWQIIGIQEILASDTPKVLQNHMYDNYFLEKLTEGDALRTRKYGWEVRNVVTDTMFQWHVLNPELAGANQEKKKGKHKTTRKGLAFLSSLFTRDPCSHSHRPRVL